MSSSLANGTCAAPWLATSRTTTGRALTSRSTRMHPTAGQLSGGTSAGSFPSRSRWPAPSLRPTGGLIQPNRFVTPAPVLPSARCPVPSPLSVVDGWRLRSVWPKIWLLSSDSTVHRLLAFPWRVTRALAARSTELAEILAKDKPSSVLCKHPLDLLEIGRFGEREQKQNARLLRVERV